MQQQPNPSDTIGNNVQQQTDATSNKAVDTSVKTNTNKQAMSYRTGTGRVDTGDNENMALWIILCAASICIVIPGIYLNRNNFKKK